MTESKKIVTVSIAAYNMEKYIRKTLDSLLDERIIDDLEVLVVDDGGTDETLAIAKEYAAKYPDSIFPIHKENGGYGSVLNYTVPRAQGKYFRILDGDDWAKTENLYSWIQLLKTLDVDLFFSPYEKIYVTRGEAIYCDICKGMTEGEYGFQEIKIDDAGFTTGITFRTALLQSVPLKLNEHCLYTDDDFVSYTMPFVNKIYVYHMPIYQYRIGRSDQSVNVNSLKRHFFDHYNVVKRVLSFWKNIPEEKIGAFTLVKTLLVSRIVDHFVICFRLSNKKTRSFYKELLFESPELLRESMKASELLNLYVKTHGLAYPLIRTYLNWRDERRFGT